MRRWQSCIDSSGPFKPKKLAMTELSVIRSDQKCQFQRDIKLLVEKGGFLRNSPPKTLSLFIDEEGIVRLSGRLKNCPILSIDKKHTLILSKSNHLVRLLFTEAHKITMHRGLNLILSHFNRKFWIVNIRRLLKSISYQCLTCI